MEFFVYVSYKSCSSPVFSYQQNISANYIYFLSALLQNLEKKKPEQEKGQETEKADSSFL